MKINTEIVLAKLTSTRRHGIFSSVNLVHITAWIQIIEALISFVISASGANVDLLKPEFAKGDTFARLLKLEPSEVAAVDIFQAFLFFCLLVLSIYLLLWTQEGNIRGLVTWLVINGLSDLLCLPLTIFLMYANNFQTSEVVINIVLYLIEIFCLWAVFNLIQQLKHPERKPPIKA